MIEQTVVSKGCAPLFGRDAHQPVETFVAERRVGSQSDHEAQLLRVPENVDKAAKQERKWQ
jgi:hypothetical protein